MSSRALLAIFAICFVLFLGIRFPLGVAAGWIARGDVPVSWSAAEGTVWDGRLRGVHAGGVDLGAVEVGLSPWSLFLLKARTDARLSGGQVMGNLTLERSLIGSRTAIRNGDLHFDLAAFDLPLPVAGSLSLDIEKLVVDGGGCRQATLFLESDALTRGGQAYGWQGPTLAGDGTCRDGKLLIPLEGRKGKETVEVDLLLGPARDYSLEVRVRTADNDAAPGLIALGFEADVDGFRIRRSGRMGY